MRDYIRSVPGRDREEGFRPLVSALERAANALHAAAREVERTALTNAATGEVPPIAARLYTVAEVAKALNLSRTKVYEFVLGGDLPSLTLGRSRRIPAAALDAWIERRGVERDRPASSPSRAGSGSGRRRAD